MDDLEFGITRDTGIVSLLDEEPSIKNAMIENIELGTASTEDRKYDNAR